MVTGRPPFLGDTPVAVASKHVRDHPPAPRALNPSIPPTFEAIILKAMDKNPDYRYATSEDLRADLLRFNEGRDVLAAHEDHTQWVAALAATGVVGGMATTESASARWVRRSRYRLKPASSAKRNPGATAQRRTPSSWPSC